jgi:hypothetical protein
VTDPKSLAQAGELGSESHRKEGELGDKGVGEGAMGVDGGAEKEGTGGEGGERMGDGNGDSRSGTLPDDPDSRMEAHGGGDKSKQVGNFSGEMEVDQVDTDQMDGSNKKGDADQMGEANKGDADYEPPQGEGADKDEEDDALRRSKRIQDLDKPAYKEPKYKDGSSGQAGKKKKRKRAAQTKQDEFLVLPSELRVGSSWLLKYLDALQRRLEGSVAPHPAGLAGLFNKSPKKVGV